MEIPVRVTILGEKPVCFESAMVMLDRRTLSVRIPKPPPLCTPVKVETAGQLWMGEVVGTDQQDKTWLAQVRIEHALRNVGELRHLADRFLGKLDRVEPTSSAPQQSTTRLPTVP